MKSILQVVPKDDPSPSNVAWLQVLGRGSLETEIAAALMAEGVTIETGAAGPCG